ncbi:hypothetical protein PR202_ga06297 [Eleusine coracana subsp. coracana]|uniref:Terpene synthase N-terminal domain-containing protein n=1 Tax=Eleusine coracana subsp. coracana TaxID=191504 RepID=A0AAV5BWC4_ELECO|nr:hypothetical protein PR202_ga06297 [Eleusine coracana subsp. coracana]
MMAAVDNLKRLCIDHYFQEEIEDVMGSCMNLIHSHDLHDATLALRLLREDGHDVSADEILRKFTNCSGEFIVALSDDIRGLLSLHDMSHLNMGGEASLYKAKEFSSKHLASVVRHLEPSLARYVRQSLDHPYHLNLMQYKARHHLRYLQSLPNRNTAMEELAIAEFHLNKLLHQEEMQETKRWWMDLGLAQTIPVARDQDEAQEGLDGSYKDFYLMENPSYACSDAKEHMHRLIEREWEELNRECFRRKRTFSSIFMQACLNAARMVSVMYGYNKEQRLPVLEDYMKMLLL